MANIQKAIDELHIAFQKNGKETQQFCGVIQPSMKIIFDYTKALLCCESSYLL